MTIKELKPEEVLELVPPLVQVTMPKIVYETCVSSLQNIKPQDYRLLFGAFVEGEFVGVSGYFYESEKQKYWISWTAVYPEHQNKGIGQKLLDYTLEYLKKIYVEEVYVETYCSPDFANVVKFYIKNDFILCGFMENFLKNGSDVLYFKKYL